MRPGPALTPGQTEQPRASSVQGRVSLPLDRHTVLRLLSRRVPGDILGTSPAHFSKH